jgi:hypothetical protein
MVGCVGGDACGCIWECDPANRSGWGGAAAVGAPDEPAEEEVSGAVNNGELIDADKFFGIKIDIVRKKNELASLGKYYLDIVTPPEGAQ